ncbi:MAG: energy-coupling factor ABC transporter ATP-binding protein [Clostridiales Family XIII bacterium]|jgi:energy-coupling factor transport system ATP-binding protein|nr:energy-coupling factor ABC transporter ATP-binding protein [Clostridiales Family XIII bacterium]
MIDIRGLTFSYDNSEPDGQAQTGGAPALEGVTLRVEDGALCVLIGPSGCGKTTLCRCITGVIPKIMKGAMEGSVSADAATGYVFQEPDHQIVMTAVEDDLAFGPENLCVPPGEIRARVSEVAAQTGLSGMELRDPLTLSGGEKQRLAIGGVLAMRPDVLVFDEPASALDGPGREAFARMAKALKAAGKTVVVCEHDFEFLDFADQWVLMKDGRVLCAAPPAEVPPALLEEELWR